MSWLSNYLFGQYSDESVVPDSYEGTAISDSFEKPVSSNLRETEVVFGIHYRDNTVQLDLDTPVEDPYAQQGYSNFGYGGDYSFVQQECYPNDSYGCQQCLQGYSNFGYGGEQSFVQQECYPNQSYGCEQSFEHQVYSNLGDDGERRMCLLTRKVVTRLHFRLIQRKPFRHVKSWCVGYKTRQKTMVTSL
ncbi:hypothetical protein HanRHA438_Chr16g0752091 [Helianthus annuus]|nr:hypothetical protein HanIR_Chr16g0804481 [Helianthus annuus]KAJ0835171.1 hypothetical protein HanRHA438_Chr16g0752091 [Helianthus annuus]